MSSPVLSSVVGSFAEPDHWLGKEVTMLRGISTMNLWADDLPAAARWYTELLGAKPLEPLTGAARVRHRLGRRPFGNVLGIMHNRHYLDILASRG
jgi:hypothetical protein